MTLMPRFQRIQLAPLERDARVRQREGQGRAARLAGHPQDTNPYDVERDWSDHWAWNLGWREANKARQAQPIRTVVLA